MQITNGTVEMEYPHKVADFQIPKAKVSLSFVIPEGEDVDMVLAKVGEMARSRAMQMAGAAPVEHVAVPPTQAAPTRSRKTPPPGPPAGDAPIVIEPPVSEPKPAVADPFGSGATAASDTSAVAPAGDTPNPAADPRLTDQALRQAIQVKLEHAPDRQTATNAVRALVTSFTNDPVKQIYTVTDPAARMEFLVKLGAL